MDNEKKSKSKGKTLELQVNSIGDLTRQLLVTPINPEASKEDQVRLSNQEIAKIVSEHFPSRKANGPNECVAWYASKLKKDAKYREKWTNGVMPLPSRESAQPKTIEITLD